LNERLITKLSHHLQYFAIPSIKVALKMQLFNIILILGFLHMVLAQHTTNPWNAPTDGPAIFDLNVDFNVNLGIFLTIYLILTDRCS
jgi:hypothetical protein